MLGFRLLSGWWPSSSLPSLYWQLRRGAFVLWASALIAMVISNRGCITGSLPIGIMAGDGLRAFWGFPPPWRSVGRERDATSSCTVLSGISISLKYGAQPGFSQQDHAASNSAPVKTVWPSNWLPINSLAVCSGSGREHSRRLDRDGTKNGCNTQINHIGDVGLHVVHAAVRGA